MCCGIIFKTTNPRNRILLELMDRGGMRVGEVLKIRAIEVQDRKFTLPDLKSGKESEVVFIPQKVADRLKNYIMRMKNEKNGPWVKMFGCKFGLLTRWRSCWALSGYLVRHSLMDPE